MYRTINKHPSGAFNTENIFLSPRNPIQQKKWHSATSTAAGKLSKSPYSFATLPHDSCANNIYIYCITSVLPLQEKESKIRLKKRMILSYHPCFPERETGLEQNPCPQTAKKGAFQYILSKCNQKCNQNAKGTFQRAS